MTPTLSFIGAGRVTRIILEGLKRKNVLPDQIYVTDTIPAVCEKLTTLYPHVETRHGFDDTMADADFIFLSLHPPAVLEVITQIEQFLTPKSTLVSLAPRVLARKLSDLSGGKCPVIRMIPNAPSCVNAGYNPVFYGEGCTNEIRRIFTDLMDPLGEMPDVAEEKLEAYAVITAMGPTCLWFQVDEMIRLATKFGLSKDEALHAVVAMSGGAYKTVEMSGLSLDEVMDLVPVRVMAENETTIRSMYDSTLTGMHNRLTME